jgi:hypothetical protein
MIRLGNGLSLALRPHVEADHHRVGGRREQDIALGDPPDARMQDAEADLIR